MKYVQIGNPTATFSLEPFPAIRGELVFGRNKRQTLMVPVFNLAIPTIYTAHGRDGRIMYQGPDKEEASLYVEMERENWKGEIWGMHNIRVVKSYESLPDHGFYVGTTKKGTVAIFGGSDTTERCLLHIHIKDGFRGMSDIREESKGVKKVAFADAHAATAGACEGLYILDKGQSVTTHSTGRYGYEVNHHMWDGHSLVSKRYTGAEWDALQSVGTDTEATERF